jgi:hypothetical protein
MVALVSWNITWWQIVSSSWYLLGLIWFVCSQFQIPECSGFHWRDTNNFKLLCWWCVTDIFKLPSSAGVTFGVLLTFSSYRVQLGLPLVCYWHFQVTEFSWDWWWCVTDIFKSSAWVSFWCVADIFKFLSSVRIFGALLSSWFQLGLSYWCVALTLVVKGRNRE